MTGDAHALRAERDCLLLALEDQRQAKQVAAEAADRFRDVVAEALGYTAENPGDDVLVHDLRRHFGKTGPEPTRWRDFLVSAHAVLDQINAAKEPTS